MATTIPILFEILEERGITQKKLAESTGISTGNISDWKSGKSTPKPAALVKIAQYLDCSVDYLLGNSENSQSANSNIDSKTLEFMEKFESLSPKDKELASDFVKMLISRNDLAAQERQDQKNVI